jgi:8-oxo-dGTP pyrophosphatase MutT (NUDIX family)
VQGVAVHDPEAVSDDAGDPPPIPAATVILVRDAPLERADGRLEVLMLHRTSQVAFGGMWVFPGGRVDDADRRPDDEGDEPAARRAAIREAAEECALVVDPAEVVAFSRWTPPAGAPKRFATWFFLARVPTGEVVVDGGEIQDHRWLPPSEVLARREAHEVDLAPPTWMTLHTLLPARDVAEAVAQAAARPFVHYVTRWSGVDGGAVAMWSGDAGYESSDPTVAGARHRLWMLEDGWRVELTD